ncbi:phosphoribosylaminoimidazole synthetase [Yersinia similis]|uniref:phosphoribosylaminoimidazole synthetase n=1 Tax=Yersinia similis TaxID=367190 RepID=UPI001643B825|nr:phosphoribosylaminoimidazole synthetase [Yersinia similis]
MCRAAFGDVATDGEHVGCEHMGCEHVDGEHVDCVGMISGLLFLNANSVEICLLDDLLITANRYGLMAE